MPDRAAATVSAACRLPCQVRRCRVGTGWRCLGVAGRVACPAAGMTGDIPPARDRRDAPAAEAGEGELIEVTFSPAEPQLTPGAARAVLAMLMRARERTGHAED